MKKYYVCIGSSLGFEPVIIEYEDIITMKNLKVFKDKAILEACNRCNRDLTLYHPQIISWQIIK